MQITRRHFAHIAAAAAITGCANSQESPQTSSLIESPNGNFRFLKGSGPYSSGAVASAGFEVVHATFLPFPKLADAFGIIEKHLEAAGRPIQALCGMELRIPKALSVDAFNEFNQPYIDRLKQWGTHVDGLNPVARTNVAIEVNPVPEAAVYGFSYTAPSDFAGKTFVIAGAGELRSSALAADEIVSRGDLSAEGLKAKTERVLAIMTERVEGLGLGWTDVTMTNIYTVHNIHPLMQATMMPALHDAGRQGVHWHFSRPPVEEIEFEMDLRGVRREIVLSA